MCAAILAALGKRGFAAASMARRLSAIRQLYRFLYAEGHRSDDPAAIIEGPKRGRTIPKVLSIERGRPPAGSCARRDGGRAAVPERLRAARLDLPSGACLRHRAARFRTGGAAGLGGGAQRAHAGGARQGRQGTAGAAQRRRQARDDRVSRAAGGSAGRRQGRNEAPPNESEMAVSFFGESGHLTPPAFRPRAESRWRPPPACAPNR